MVLFHCLTCLDFMKTIKIYLWLATTLIFRRNNVSEAILKYQYQKNNVSEAILKYQYQKNNVHRVSDRKIIISKIS